MDGFTTVSPEIPLRSRLLQTMLAVLMTHEPLTLHWLTPQVCAALIAVMPRHARRARHLALLYIGVFDPFSYVPLSSFRLRSTARSQPFPLP